MIYPIGSLLLLAGVVSGSSRAGNSKGVSATSSIISETLNLRAVSKSPPKSKPKPSSYIRINTFSDDIWQGSYVYVLEKCFVVKSEDLTSTTSSINTNLVTDETSASYDAVAYASLDCTGAATSTTTISFTLSSELNVVWSKKADIALDPGAEGDGFYWA
jgi:hypothetical protein